MSGGRGKIVHLRHVPAWRNRHGVTPEPVAPSLQTPSIFEPDPAEADLKPDPIGLTPAAFAKYEAEGDAEAIRNLGTVFYSQPDVPDFVSLTGVKQLMGKPVFDFLRAVHADDIDEAMSLYLRNSLHIRPYLNRPSFFFFTGSSDACFVTAAHLARSFDMAHFLANHLGCNFKLADSEGRLPQLYWAEHASDDMIFPYGEQVLGLDMSRGGKLLQGDDYVTPMWRAIEANNMAAAKGLSVCVSAQVNAPRPNDWGRYTPLMIQSVKVDHIRHGRSREPLRPALRTLWAIARGPNVDWGAKDFEGHAVTDIGLEPRTRRLLDIARRHPWPSEPLGLRHKLA